MADEAKWYVAHTYSGYEHKVKSNLEKSVENRGMENYIHKIEVPEEDVVEKKDDGTEKVIKRKIFPGYVVIKMIMNDESWYVVRNTRGVTGFVGPGSKPVPLSDAEVEKMGVDSPRQREVEYNIGDIVEITSGPMEGFTGRVSELDRDSAKATVMISMFGRETPAEVQFSQLKMPD